ncbi:MAG TPA: Ig-like domain-containing protein [Bryobacteraceae bacterium]|nr:Ig-like domain-containing protein [Bryobacteraceae bacterium]
MRRLAYSFVLSLFASLLAPWLLASGVTVLWNPADPTVGPYPSDALTVPDSTQKSGLRINLPMPDCTAAPSDCQDIQLINQLDGFQTAPRITIRFSGPIDVNSVHHAIYYVALRNLTDEEHGITYPGQMLYTTQMIYDPTTNTLYGKPDGNLDQHSQVAVIVTDAIRDLNGDPVEADPGYTACAGPDMATKTIYCAELSQAMQGLAGVVAPANIVGATVFTTMNVTTWMEKAHAQVANVIPPPTTPPAVIPYSNISSLVLHEQVADNPAQFVDVALPLNIPLFQGIGSVAFGTFASPNFLNDQQVIPWTPTGQDVAAPATNLIYYHVFLPSTPEPAGGYPVVIYGHGLGDSQWGGPSAVAPVLAQAGFATIAINAVGHGFGPQSQVIVTDRTGNVTTFTAGGRSVDLDGDGTIGPYEGCLPNDPAQVALRDCLRQTAIDLSALVHMIEGGLVLNGGNKPDLDASRIYYVGESLGSLYGNIFAAVEPNVRASVFNVGGGTTEDIVRWSQSYHSLAAALLGMRTPSLLNEGDDFNDNYVFPYQPVKVNEVPGAIAIQNAFELYEWWQAAGDPVSFAPHTTASPLPGVPYKRVLFQVARDDTTMPNIATTRLIKAANHPLTWEYRHDLALADGLDLPQDPHPFLVMFIGINGSTVEIPGLDAIAIGLAAQHQVASFFTSDGKSAIDPNTLLPWQFSQPLYEIPAHLPEDNGY